MKSVFKYVRKIYLIMITKRSNFLHLLSFQICEKNVFIFASYPWMYLLLIIKFFSNNPE